jgi:CRISPR-associated endonuclease/helicase Cas3
VDIDFLVVFRAMGPLESIVQAAGRCNREGKASKGYVHIFIPEDEAYPDTAYKQAAEVTYNLLRERGPEEMDIHNVDLLQDYYNKLYSICRPQDSDRARCLNEAIECSDFEEVARLYRIIDKNTVNLLVPYDQSIFDELADEVRKSGLNSRWIRRARPYTISIFYPDRDSRNLAANGKDKNWSARICT